MCLGDLRLRVIPKGSRWAVYGSRGLRVEGESGQANGLGIWI